MTELTDKELREKIKKVFQGEQFYALVMANTIMALLMEKEIISDKEYNEIKEDVINIMVDKWIEKYKSDPELKKMFDGSELLKKFFNFNL